MGNQGTYQSAGAEAETRYAPIPPLGAETSYVVPATYRLRLISLATELAHTSVVRAGFKILRLTSDPIYSVVCAANMAAGTQTLVAAAGIGYSFTVHNKAVSMSLPVGLILVPGDIILTQSFGMLAGDVYSKLRVTGDWWINPS